MYFKYFKCVPLKFDYVINGSQLNWHTLIQYLEVHINSKLSWNDHCSKLLLKLQDFNFLHHTLYGYTKDSEYKSFLAFILPILEYACQAWDPHTQKCIKQLESIQYRDAKWICGTQHNSLNFTWTLSSSKLIFGISSRYGP